MKIKEKVKNVWKEHNVEIIIGGTVVIIGGALVGINALCFVAGYKHATRDENIPNIIAQYAEVCGADISTAANRPVLWFGRKNTGEATAFFIEPNNAIKIGKQLIKYAEDAIERAPK